MGRYFEYKDWEIEEITNAMRERLAEARQPLPEKVKKHCVSIRYRTGKYSYSWWNNEILSKSDFSSFKEAADYLDSLDWIERLGDNMWVEKIGCPDRYDDEDGNSIPCHYMIYEYDCEVYVDGEYHTEYTDDDRKALEDGLYCVEKARVYMRAFDHACDNGSFGGSFSESLRDDFEKFEKEYTEDLPSDWYDGLNDT